MKKVFMLIPFLLSASLLLGTGQNLLFVGSNGGTQNIFQIDQNNGNANSAFVNNFEIYGMAVDLQNNLLYLSNSTGLYSLPVGGGTPTFIGDPMASLFIAGLAFSNGVLYGIVDGTSDLVTLNLTTGLASPPVSLTGNASVLQGLTADPVTGTLYGTDDGQAAILQVNLNGTTSVVAAYPPGFNDFDGAAMDDKGNIYLVSDQSSEDIQVYNLGSGTYQSSIPNPITGGSVSGGAAFFCIAAVVPTLSEWGLIVLGLLLLTFGTISIRQVRKRNGRVKQNPL